MNVNPSRANYTSYNCNRSTVFLSQWGHPRVARCSKNLLASSRKEYRLQILHTPLSMPHSFKLPIYYLQIFLILNKIKIGLWNHLAICVSVYHPYQIVNAWTNLTDTRLVYRGAWAHLNGKPHKSLPSVCVPVFVFPIVARQRLGKHVPAATNSRNNRRIVGRFDFYMTRVLSKNSLWVCMCTPIFSLCTAEALVWRLPEPSDSKLLHDHESRGTQNRGSMCWRGSAAIYWTGLNSVFSCCYYATAQ
jgi:hypothetical protein